MQYDRSADVGSELWVRRREENKGTDVAGKYVLQIRKKFL